MNKQYRTIRIRVNEEEFSLFQKYKDDGLTERDIIEAISRPCAKCENAEIVVFNKKDESIKVKKVLLFQKTNQKIYNK